MSPAENRPAKQHSPHGQIGYLQLPALDPARSAAFYQEVFGWSAEPGYGSFEAPGMIGQWTTDLAPAVTGGPVLWICADQLGLTLHRVVAAGGVVLGAPRLDNGERWLTEINDPAGNRIGVVVPARSGQPQPMLAVRDVEASSRWYQRLLGLESDHGGPDYERLLADGVLVLQLHQQDVEHHHGRISEPSDGGAPDGSDGPGTGSGALIWFGEVADFDDVVSRAEELEATIKRAPHRNPPPGQGNGPGHREIWLADLDGYTVVVASPDGEAFEL